MQTQQCLFCGHMVQLVHVHGHYQCPVCFTNALPCCDGDNCSTNHLLKEILQEKDQYIKPVTTIGPEAGDNRHSPGGERLSDQTN